jgi:hypothetical protein
MHDLGRILIALGLLLVLVGAVILGLNRLNLPLGRLPGEERVGLPPSPWPPRSSSA